MAKVFLFYQTYVFFFPDFYHRNIFKICKQLSLLFFSLFFPSFHSYIALYSFQVFFFPTNVLYGVF